MEHLRTATRLGVVFIALSILAAALVLVSVSVPAVSAQQVERGHITATVTVGSNESGNLIGFARNSFGDISPDGFISNNYSGSISQVVWDTNDEVIRVTFSADTSYPLTEVRIDGENYDCVSNTSRVFTCEHDDDEVPWEDGDRESVRFTFTATPERDTDPTPIPTRDIAELPGGYGPRSSGDDITLHSNNDSFEGIATDGSHLFIYDTADNKVYGYSLEDGSHDESRDFNMPDSIDRKGFAYLDGYFWFIDDRNSRGDSSAPYQYANLYRLDVTFRDDGNDPDMRDPELIPMEGTNQNRWTAYHMEEHDGRLLVRYSYYDSSNTLSYYVGEWFSWVGEVPNDPDYTVESFRVSEERTGTTNEGTAWFTTDGNERIWYPVGDIVNPDDGVSDGHGVGGYDLGQMLEDGTTTRQNWFDIFAHASTNPAAFFYYNNLMYIIQGTNSNALAYQAAESAAAIVTDDTIGQYPPTLELEVDRTYERGDAALVDIRMIWTHTSRVDEGEGNAVMEYRLSSRVTGMVDPEDIRAYPTEYVIEGLPRENYNLTVGLRYLWYNQDDANHILIKNPPGVPDSVCESENDDEFTSALGNDDDIDATEDADTQTPGCAFYLDPGATRHSRWAEATINIVGLLQDVPVPGDIEPVRHMSGLPGAVAEFMIVMGSDPATVGPTARTMTIMGWMALALVVGIGVYAGTGMQGGSMYLGTFLFLIIWTGLGPFVAGVPDAMAYIPAAVLLFAVIVLILKRGRI